jgi:lipoate-protein ligase B
MRHTELFQVHDLGLIDYEMAYEAQMSILATILEGAESTLILCEHPPVVTCGRLSRKENILGTLADFQKKGVTMKQIDRGGDVTLHAPGQLVLYTIFDLERFGKDLHAFLRRLEEAVIAVLADFAIEANRSDGGTGVWVGKRKIASMGIGVKKWVSYHGIGLNVNTDLELFKLINPCGLGVAMTSMREQKGAPVDMEKVKESAIRQINDVFKPA